METTNGPINRKLRMGLVGGGQGAFIGRVHVTAAVLDNRAALVAGALSSDPAKAKASAPAYDIPADRAYGSFQEMIDVEAKLPADKQIDFVSITTPNHMHFPVAKAALSAGFNVCCDKPMTFDLAQAEELLQMVEKSGVVFAVTHNYTGYPLIRQAPPDDRSRVNSARFRPSARTTCKAGCASRLETSRTEASRLANRPGQSRARPAAFGDIGTHAYNLARYA